jgi:hypothetical protein
MMEELERSLSRAESRTKVKSRDTHAVRAASGC